MKVKLAIASCVAVFALALPAAPSHAGDLYAPGLVPVGDPYVANPYPAFNGWYMGGHLGAAFGQIDGIDRSFGFTDPAAIAGPAFFVPFQTSDINGGNAFGGLQFGYNGSWGGGYGGWGGSFLWGIEVDIGGMGKVLNDQAVTVMSPFDGSRANVFLKSDGGWYGDVTGRIGYNWGPALIYAKGGFAWFDPNVSIRATFIDARGNAVALTNNNDDNGALTGWTVGGGFEYLLAGNWTMKFEYLHFDFSGDNNNHCCFDGINDFRFNNRDLTVDTVKVGFNYLFRPLPVPLK